LIAAHETIEEIRRDIGADSLGYLSTPGLVRAVGDQPAESFCMACFTGNYPMEVPTELDKLGLEPPIWARDHHDIEWEPQPAAIQSLDVAQASPQASS
jgi:hypothetical protein